MPTYLIQREIAITRQAGDVADIVITVPALLSMTGRTAKFQVRDSGNRVVISKNEPVLTIVNQVISIQLLPADTKNKAGQYRWELEVSNDDGPVTIGKGPFIITKTDIA